VQENAKVAVAAKKQQLRNALFGEGKNRRRHEF
jgi:hypothetical protein